MAHIDYRSILNTSVDGLIRRDVSRDDASFAGTIAAVLRSLLGRRPRPVDRISPRLQGNLCEFCVWELGENHWGLYARTLTWPANAKSPWRDVSRPGVDILAIDGDADTVFLIEVKSTCGGGSDAVASEDDSLKADFQHLFEGSPEERIWGSINEAVADLILHGRRDLAERVTNAVGSKPEECTGVQLIGVLVCQSGKTTRSHNARKQAFQRLHRWLLLQGWHADQCRYCCVELSDFRGWLSRLVEEVTK